eukprot:Clim_evm55s128 gene=Clim_evmTU55s128
MAFADRPELRRRGQPIATGATADDSSSEGDEVVPLMRGQQRALDDRRIVSVVTQKINDLLNYLIRENPLLLILIFRVHNALFLQTSFVADEYWQSLEVAHGLVYGCGLMTWEWEEGLRSYTFPLIFATLYQILRFLGLDSAWALITFPRILSGIVYGFADYATMQLTRRFFGNTAGAIALVLSLTNWFAFFAGPRTLTNGWETALVAQTLVVWIWPDEVAPGAWQRVPHRDSGSTHAKDSKATKKTPSEADNEDVSPSLRSTQSRGHCSASDWHLITRTALAALYCGLATMLRPTAAIVLAVLMIQHAVCSPSKRAVLAMIVLGILPVVVILVAAQVAIDSYFYGHFPTFTPLRFLTANVGHGGLLSSRYGVQDALWYAYSGLPQIAPLEYPLAMFGFSLLEFSSPQAVLGPVALVWVGLHSAIRHKEQRFAMPLLPIVNCYAASVLALGLSRTSRRLAQRKTKKNTPEPSQSRTSANNTVLTRFPFASKNSVASFLQRYLTYILCLLISTNLAMGSYLSFVHQRGTLDAVHYLQGLHESQPRRVKSVLYAMPCHSAPAYSHLGPTCAIDQRHLDCSPPRQGTDAWRALVTHGEGSGPGQFEDEADCFLREPAAWWTREYGTSGSGKPPPTHIVCFDGVRDRLEQVIRDSGYELVQSFLHTHFPEPRRGGQVLVYERKHQPKLGTG